MRILVTNDDGIVIAQGAWYAGVGDVQGAASHTEDGETTFYLNGTYYEGHGLIVSGVGTKAKYSKYLYNANPQNSKYAYSPQGMYITTKDGLWCDTEMTKDGEYERVVFYVNRNNFMP